ncbi:hypothetical protein HHK36_009541 [Tetracentron sinense]|uniref:Uncharacterized protein n=1 Tax=Tetracentron sinense TaxID=13715 RepID=A0A835DIB7_TETSI|nr:hypothetical protein HHK36_009541 [Tetracentron sinense]
MLYGTQLAGFGVLQAVYFIHYLFSSQTSYVEALYSAFLAMHLASGVPVNVDLPKVFRLGLIMSLINVAIWEVVGTFWWRFLCLY